MINSIAMAAQTFSKPTSLQADSSQSYGDSYRDMMDRVMQSDKTAEKSQSLGQDKQPAKAQENTGDQETGKDSVVEDATVTEKAMAANPWFFLFDMQMRDTAQLDPESLFASQNSPLDGLIGMESGEMLSDMNKLAVGVQEALPQDTAIIQEAVLSAEDVIRAVAPEIANVPVKESADQVSEPKSDFGKEVGGAETVTVQNDQKPDVRLAETAGKDKQESQKGSEEAMGNHASEMTAGLSKDAVWEPGLQNMEQTQASETAGQSGSAADAKEILGQLPGDMADRIALGQKEFTVQLEPEHLGKLLIKASYEDGKATVSIFCTNEKTLALLSSHAREIGSIMETNLGSPTNIVLDKSEENYLNQQQKDSEAGEQARQEQQRRESENDKRKPSQSDFLAALRLGLV